jgi:tetratricopeptide (TPR) repeat protein
MKYLFTSACLCTFWAVFSQVTAPKASPSSRLEQRVGLTDITITYSRPSVNGRVIFGDLVPYNEYWRLGANESTKLTCTDMLIFGKDTLKAGTYAVYAKPSATEWQVAFYTEYGNWGLPEKWDESKVALTLKSSVISRQESVENLTIDINNIENNGGDIVMAWDKVKIQIPFTVLVKEKVLASIKKVLSGPTANDYHTAAKYYLDEKIDDKQALEWVDKAITMRPEAYWMLRTKSLIQASLGKYSEAISTAEQCLKLAEADGDSAYVIQCKNSIAEWKKRK